MSIRRDLELAEEIVNNTVFTTKSDGRDLKKYIASMREGIEALSSFLESSNGAIPKMEKLAKKFK